MLLLPRRKVNLEAFLPHVMAVVQGDSRPELPSVAALSYLRNAAIKFAKETQVLKRTCAINLQEGMDCYPLLDPECESIHMISSVETDGFPVECVTFDDQQMMLTGPSGDGIADVTVIVKPSRSCCEVDEILYEDWHDPIVDLALSEIHLMPQQPWTSGGASRERAAKAQVEINKCTTKRLKQGVVARQHVRRNHGYM